MNNLTLGVIYLQDGERGGGEVPFTVTVGFHQIWIDLVTGDGDSLASVGVDYFEGHLRAVVYPFDAEIGGEAEEPTVVDLVDNLPPSSRKLYLRAVSE